MRRLLPVPLLAVSTAGALLAPSAGGGWTARDTALVAAAAVWSVAVTARLRPDASPRWRLVAFAVYTTLAALLVGTDTWYGVFAYSGFLFAHGLGPRWRIPAFGATALVVSAAMVGGYPTGAGKGLLTYLMVAGVMLALVINSATITYRALEQNVGRGRMIRELAEANGRLEETMAENAGLHAQLLAQARAAGVLEERRRMAGEIHDTLAQGLTGIVTQLQAAEQARHRPEQWPRHIAPALAGPGQPDRGPPVGPGAAARAAGRRARLPEALGRADRALVAQPGIAAEVDDHRHRGRCAGDAEVALLRVAQEALANVGQARAGGQGRADAVLHGRHGALDVRDDGVGFDPTGRPMSRPDSGYGLVGMRQRLAGVGGTLTVESAPGYGTALGAAVPLPVAGRCSADPAADRRRPPDRPGRAARHVQRRRRSSRWSARPATGPRRSRSRSGVDADVILMDLRMPAMDGVEAIRRLRQRRHPARVLVLTTYDTDATCCPRSRPARPATCSRTRRGTSCSARSGPRRRARPCWRRRWPAR